MFRVIVVDDEPAAIDYICKLINDKNPDFEVVATAENPLDGLEKVRVFEPDLVITDIKMPFMNGIEFISKVKEEMPLVDTIIISGYSDFEYMKGAILSGASDYILKPVNPSALKATLDKMVDKIKKTQSNRRNKLLRAMSREIPVGEKEIKRCFPSKSYYAAIIRQNGLPRRFVGNSSVEIFSTEDEMIYLYGRDELEALYIFPQELVKPNRIDSIVYNILNKQDTSSGYYTTVIKKKSFSPEKIYDVVRALYATLDTRIVVGKNQIIYLEDNCIYKEAKCSSEKLLINEIKYLIEQEKWPSFKEKLTELIKMMERQEYTQLCVERYLKLIFGYLQFKKSSIFSEGYEFMLEDAFFYAENMRDLNESVLDVINKSISQNPNSDQKLDTPEFIENIKDYLHEHVSKQINLQSVCKKFGISQTYLSKLFNKYENTTFNNYLTSIRIEYATKLIKENKDFYVKDIAAMVGYKDQFYFSRVFNSVMGMSPSAYAESLE